MDVSDAASDAVSTWTCPTDGCSFVTHKKYKLEEHLRVHTGERPFICNSCGKSFRRVDHLKRHESVHFGSSDSRCRFVCPVESCGKAFSLNHHLKRHMAIHANPRPHTCPSIGCSMSFAKRNQLRVHLQTVHNVVDPSLVCDVCHKPFSSKALLHKHKVSRHASVDSPFICFLDGCQACFVSEEGLLKHIDAEHGRVEVVPKKFSSSHSAALDNDDMADYSSEEEESCDRLLIAPHEFACPYQDCDRTFSRRSNLQQHVKAAHLHVRPHVCKNCGNAFSFAHVLRRHEERCHSKDDALVVASGTQDTPHDPEIGPPPAKKRRSRSKDVLTVLLGEHEPSPT